MKESRKTRYTRKVLQESLIELMKEKPFMKITVKEICARADVNRTTFYAHYSDPYDLLSKIEDQAFSWAKEMIDHIHNRQGELDKILEEIFQYIADNQSHIRVLMSQQGDISFPAKIFTLVYERCGISVSGEGRRSLDAKELDFIFIVNGSVGLIQHWLNSGLSIPVKELASTVYNMAAQIQYN